MPKGHNPRIVRTPIDPVRELLSRAEYLVAREQPSAAQALELLRVLDQVSSHLAQLEGTSAARRAEAVRFEEVQRGLYLRRASFASAARAPLSEEQQASPCDSRGWWWQLDEVVARESSRRRRRASLGGAIAVVILAGAWLVYDRTIRPPAHIREALRCSAIGENLAEDGPGQDFSAALAQFELAAQLDPSDPAYLIWAGVVHAQLGNQRAAGELFIRASALYDTRLHFLNVRSSAYVLVGGVAAANADAEEAVALFPDNGFAYIMRAYAAGRSGDRVQAAADLSAAKRVAGRDDDQMLGVVVAEAAARLGVVPELFDSEPAEAGTPPDL